MSLNTWAVRAVATIWAGVRLIHPFPVALVLVVSAGLLSLTYGQLPPIASLLRALGVVLCSQVAVGTLNDWLDRSNDAREQPDKPIPSGAIPAIVAPILTAASLTCMIPLALSFGFWSLFLALLGTTGGLAYDIWLKPTPASVLGYFVGFMALITWVWQIAGHLTWWFALVYPAASLVLVAAHLAQSAPDIESDARLGQHGLAVTLGFESGDRLTRFALGMVATGAAVGSVLSHVWWSLALVLSASICLAAAWLMTPNALLRREERVRRFHLLAPGIALLGASCFLLLRSLS